MDVPPGIRAIQEGLVEETNGFFFSRPPQQSWKISQAEEMFTAFEVFLDPAGLIFETD